MNAPEMPGEAVAADGRVLEAYRQAALLMVNTMLAGVDDTDPGKLAALMEDFNSGKAKFALIGAIVAGQSVPVRLLVTTDGHTSCLATMHIPPVKLN